MKPLARVLMEGARAHSFVLQTLQRLDPAIGAMLSHGLTVEERLRLTNQLYEDSPHYRGEGLWGFEDAWFGKRLPKPDPAGPGPRLLVGACGGGREAWWLEKRGYDVDAFDQAPGMVARAAAKAAHPQQYATFSYQDLADHVLRGTGPVPDGWLRAPYDAVLLGWGSLIHVLDPVERAELFAAADRLCPRGPILASFYLRDEQAGDPGRSIRYGARVGTAIARMRGVDPRTSAAEMYVSNSGFGLRFTRAEIEDLAGTIGREVIWEHRTDDEFPHATFVKPADPA